MIPDRIAQIEATLHSSAHIPEATRRELLELLASLKTEVAALGESAQHLAGSADEAVKAAVARDRPEETTEALAGLTLSVREFEASHPRLVQVVDRLALVLSNMGI